MTSIGHRAFGDYNGLTSITCLATTPPQLYERDGFYYNPFEYETTQKATLYVPAEAVNRYKTADGWNVFYNIEAITSGIDEIIADMDEDMASDEEVDIYTLSGTHVYNGPQSEARLAKGFYIVRHGNTVNKVYFD